MKKYEMDLNGNKLSIETGKIARQSDGAVMVTHVIMLGEKFQVVFLRERLDHRSMKS